MCVISICAPMQSINQYDSHDVLCALEKKRFEWKFGNSNSQHTSCCCRQMRCSIVLLPKTHISRRRCSRRRRRWGKKRRKRRLHAISKVESVIYCFNSDAAYSSIVICLLSFALKCALSKLKASPRACCPAPLAVAQCHAMTQLDRGKINRFMKTKRAAAAIKKHETCWQKK